ncbi:Nucleolar complex protein 2 [Bienertia sinuspersici]
MKLRSWTQTTFGSFTKEMRECRNEMAKLMEEVQMDTIIAKMKALDNRMTELESREVMYRKQQSR